MAWLGAIATGICGFAFFVASEWASGLKDRKLTSRGALGVAMTLFIGCIATLVCFPPAEGLQRNLVVAISGATALACFWFVKSHVNHFRGNAAVVAGLLGLSASALGFVVLIDKMPKVPIQATAEKPAESSEEWVARQKSDLAKQRKELERRLTLEIPEKIRKLQNQADETKRDMANANAGNKVRLESDLQEIAQMLVALEKKQAEISILIPRIKSQERRLERVEISKLLDDNEGIRNQVDEVWKEAAAAISKPVDEARGSTVDDLDVKNKMSELLQ